jgi:hypothetical protein
VNYHKYYIDIVIEILPILSSFYEHKPSKKRKNNDDYQIETGHSFLKLIKYFILGLKIFRFLFSHLKAIFLNDKENIVQDEIFERLIQPICGIVELNFGELNNLLDQINWFKY